MLGSLETTHPLQGWLAIHRLCGWGVGENENVQQRKMQKPALILASITGNNKHSSFSLKRAKDLNRETKTR